MIPQSLKLVGSVHIKSGLNVDTLTIDFTKFQPGLIAFIGDNGAGKTTIIEHATPFPQMASYQSRKYSDHFFLKNSEKDFRWIYNGIHYRSYFQIDGVTGKAKYFLYKEDIPVNQDGGLSSYVEQVEKIIGSADLFFKSQFTAQKATNIGSLEPSERKQIFMEILSIDKYEKYHKYIKEKTDGIEKDLEKSRNELALYSDELSNLETLKTELQTVTQELNKLQLSQGLDEASLRVKEKEKIELEFKLAELNTNLELLKKEEAKLFEKETNTLLPLRGKHRSKIASLQTQQEELEKTKAEHNLILARKDELLLQIKNRTTEINNLQLAITGQDNIIADRSLLEKEIADLTTKQIDTKNRYEAEIQRLTTKLSEINPKLDRTQKIIDNKEEINTTKAKLDGLRDQEKVHSENKDLFYQKSNLVQKATEKYNSELNIWTKKQNEIETRLISFRHDYISFNDRIQNERNSLKKEIELYTASASLIDQKPENDPPEMYSICKLLTSALDAKKKVDELEIKLSALMDTEHPSLKTLSDVQKRIDETTQSLVIHNDAKPSRETITALETETQNIGYDMIVHKRVQSEITALETAQWEKLFNELTATEETHKTLTADKKECDQLLEAQKSELSKEQQWYTTAIAERQTKLNGIPEAESADQIREKIAQKESDNQRDNNAIVTAETTIKNIDPQLIQISKDRGIELLHFTEEESKLLHEIETIKSEIEILTASKQDIITIDTKINTCTKEIERITALVADQKTQIDRLTETKTLTNSKIISAEQMKQKSDTIQALIDTNLKKLSNWNILKDACSNNGIPQIEIDAAAPGVSQIVNQELSETFGNEFKVRFITLEPYADEKKGMKEVFEIMIQQNGMEERKIKDFSGGQAVWINRSIADALAIYAMRKEGKHSQTNFLDESDGALDPENKQRYFQMLHNAFKNGNRYYTILITHDQNIQSQIQQRIKFNKGNSTTPIEYHL
jgi:DNA repair exonuclease SbcCD ATPase subunit